ncbi:glycoside hydrolase family 3 N-terminal domain-containing protein [Methyloceanibacter sp.]|uniref:glycoside hydrolase family 3 N-terminal domain-containing protein n=1 Tax=Methyloceanibacter sp. TaxID=1965321 RepID=UPI002D464BB1|nr:glycoside hydrolase family 3 N-terminal domain-containing protein [Methyloceanibacter sp.]HZP10525.1 glycoside hydrolase family 3 N-terminal domain-containing protein [Methyloceanibacter sp.]
MSRSKLPALLALLAASAALFGSAIAAPETDATKLDAMIGQMIMVGFAGTETSDAGVLSVRDEIGSGTIGGVVLYPENIRSPQQITALTAFLRNARSQPVPFIAVDQEGGKVQRLSRENGHSYFPSARDVGQNPSYATPESAFKLYAAMAKELADSGFNLNFGPVVDLNLNPANPVIAGRERSFGSDPARVISFARAFIRAHRDAGIVTVAKHFPGHGSSSADSHKGFADISMSWQEVELDPYRVLAKEGLLDAVMIGHLYHPRFSDGEMLPASLSAKAIRALRNTQWIDFDGVVFSDDMEMGAVSQRYSIEERVIKAINAGTDIIVFSNVGSHDPDLGAKIHAIIAAAVSDGRISRLRIEQANDKIKLLKRRLAQHELAGKW